MLRRWSVWGVCGAFVALLAFAPFRDTRADTSGAGLGTPLSPAAGGAPSDGSAATSGDGGRATGSTTGAETGAESTSSAGTTGSSGSSGRDTSSDSTPDEVVPPRLATPTPAQLAVLGPLISAMDTGQRAGTPLVLGIATSLVATGLPGDDDVPAELRPVVAALADVIATPGAQVNDLTTQNSVYLAQLDRALGELAFANPALNEVIHEVADQLAAFGRSAAPSSPPGAVFLSDLSVLLTHFVVE